MPILIFTTYKSLIAFNLSIKLTFIFTNQAGSNLL